MLKINIFPMKRIALLCILGIMTSLTFAQTQATAESPVYRNLVKFSPSMFVRNTFQMGYEHFLTPSTSLNLNAGVNFRDNNNEQSWGFTGEAQLKLYVYTQVNPKNSNRLYFAPYIAYNHENEQTNTWNSMGYNEWTDDTYDAGGLGIIFGYSFSFANRMNMDIYSGGGIRKAFNVDDNNDNNGLWDYSYSGISPRLGIDIGFWF
jgi:hypothetical protein